MYVFVLVCVYLLTQRVHRSHVARICRQLCPLVTWQYGVAMVSSINTKFTSLLQNNLSFIMLFCKSDL